MSTDQNDAAPYEAPAEGSPEPEVNESAKTEAIPSVALRWWPPVVIVSLMLITKLIPSFYDTPPLAVMMIGFMGPTLIGGLLLLWWLFASRASIREKMLGFLGLSVVAVATYVPLHPTMVGMPVFMYQLPVGLAAFALPLIFLAGRPSIRLAAALGTALIGFGVFDLVRFDGVTGTFAAEFSQRWAITAEEEYLESLEAQSESAETVAGDQSLVITATEAEWPEFRGRDRSSVVSGLVLAEDWDQSPPELVWKTRVGPGWSSFSVAGNRLFTQEQRGESEAVVCLDAETGKIIWSHEYPGRFWESIAGAGPRATPTIGDNALFCVGADGMVMSLNPVNGEPIWTRNLRDDASREPPVWGWSASPLVVDSKVIVHAGGADDKGIFAFDAQSGEVVWSAPSGDHSYSSAQLASFNGVSGILMLSNSGLQFLDIENGATIWDYEWKSANYRVLQPFVDGDSVLVSGSLDEGMVKISVTQSDDQWEVTETWATRSMKPAYNDFVVHEGEVYGFDASIFASMNLESGDRNWKRGRYGNGQVLLLDESGQLLLISEKGELVLLKASPDKMMELAKFPAIEGKTWNHPVLINNRVYLRNGEEAACYSLPIGTTPL